MHQSIATIDSPQFLNLQPLDINPLMSKCEIKVLYVGENRNHTFINQATAIQIGKALRGAPIVGYYKKNVEDYADHGEKIIIDDEGIKFECQTVPYGFVSPDAQVWFQNFEDEDSYGNTVIHKYLMTTGYLWTDQFPESSLPVNQGRPQSMEFKPDSVQGHWETNPNTGIDFFIINDAVIQKLCILGDEVEPCFQGASITAPNVSAKFTLDDDFKHTLYSMMQDLKNALNGGEQQMKDQNTTVDSEMQKVETTFEKHEDSSTEEKNENEEATPVDYVKKDQEEKKEEASDNQEDNSSSEDSQDTNDEKEDEKDEDDDKKKNTKYELLESELNELKEQYSALQVQYQSLVDFKNEIDNQQKDALIAEFFMLSDEDKQDVIQNKSKYTLDEIKAKLSVICFDKKINFNLSETEKDEAEKDVTVYNLNNNKNDSLPDWIKAVKEQEKLG